MAGGSVAGGSVAGGSVAGGRPEAPPYDRPGRVAPVAAPGALTCAVIAASRFRLRLPTRLLVAVATVPVSIVATALLRPARQA
ncbi:hypothetical protein [Streptomyces sp. Root1310]|uniref:hypothetical protein n=1 Tax=Streptomyces sp. Root1310 TaxID=1736452 RepID=UPI000AB82F59|nr:hypothetical protein [Streptomyces sp. Root1310]